MEIINENENVSRDITEERRMVTTTETETIETGIEIEIETEGELTNEGEFTEINIWNIKMFRIIISSFI